MSNNKTIQEKMIEALLDEDSDLDEYGEWSEIKTRHHKTQVDDEYGQVKLREPIDLKQLTANKGQILELDQTELNSAEIAQLATQMAMDDIQESRDDALTNEFNSSYSPKDLYGQHLSDNIEEFKRQIKTMEQIVQTNGIDGIPIEETSSEPSIGGIWKKIVSIGSGETIPIGSLVRIHYNAYFELNDEPYDSTHIRRRPFEFRLGKFNVLPGLEFAVRTMQRREKAKFIMSSDLLYGEQGCPPRIPANAWSLYTIELISWIDYNLIEKFEQYQIKDDEESSDNFDERFSITETLRDLGNEEYSKQNMERAIRFYAKGKQFLLKTKAKTDDERKRRDQLFLKLYLNSAQCYLKIRNFERAVKNCNEALEIDGKNVKALYRISVGYRWLQEFDRARHHLQRAINISPYSCEIIDEAQRLDRAIEQQKKIEQKLYYRMFNQSCE